MDRRTFLRSGVIATLAAKVLSDNTLARAQSQTPEPSGLITPPPDPVPAAKLILDADSRFLHWLRDPNEIAEAIVEITCGGLMVTVGEGRSHVSAANVQRELPAFVNAIRRNGLNVVQVRGGSQTSVDPVVEALVGTMGQLKITHYRLGADSYDLTKPLLPQLDATKRKIERFVTLNQKHGTTLMYPAGSGGSSIGAAGWDLLYVLKDFDPKYVGLHWDTSLMAGNPGMAETAFRAARPYVVGMAWQDRTWKQDLARIDDQGGPYPGPGRGRGGAGGVVDDDAVGAGGGRGGRGGSRVGDLSLVPSPIQGTSFARGGGWTTIDVPMGTGTVDLFTLAKAMRETSFNAPMNLEVRYSIRNVTLDADAMTALPRQFVIGTIKRDVLTIRAALMQSARIAI